jgi:arginase
MARSGGAVQVELIGVPYNSSGLSGGVAAAPAFLREAGLGAPIAEVVVHAGSDVTLSEPTPVRGPSGLLAEDSLVEMANAVAARVRNVMAASRMPLVVGGDCPVLLGALAACRDRYGEVGLLFVDGHEDAWPPSASTTGEAADCELGLALGRDIGRLPSEVRRLLPLVSPEAVVALGPRDADEIEAAGVSSLAGTISVIRPPAIQHEHARGDLAGFTTRQVDLVRRRTAHWWLHVDLDVLATEELAAVDYQQPGGLMWSQLDIITRSALVIPGCVGWTVTIYNPDLDGGRAAPRIVRYVHDALVAMAAP